MIFSLVNGTYMCHVESKKNCYFVDLFEFFFTFWNLIHFWPRRFSLNSRKLLILSIFIFCLVCWTYMPRELNKMYDFVDIFEFSSMFWNLIYFWPRRLSLNFKIIVNSINIYILPCKLDLCSCSTR